jgi:outer-membrane receptor for ferric coprogen and ferric-rhodotorulic acid
MNGAMHDYADDQQLLELTGSGTFELFGHEQQLLFGANYQALDGDGLKTYGRLYLILPGPAVNVFAFDPSLPAYTEPASQRPIAYYQAIGQQQWGAYTTLRFTPFAPLHFITGLRYSGYTADNHTFGTTAATGQLTNDAGRREVTGHDLSWPPTYSVVYDATKTLSVYASYAEIYQPQLNDVDASGTPMEPIVGSNVEAGLKLESLDGALNATLAAYRIHQKNQAVFDTNGTATNPYTFCCYRKGDQDNLSEGVDAEVTGRLLPGLQVFAGYTYNLNEVRGDDYYGPDFDGPKTPLVSRSPKHLLKLWATYQMQGDFLHSLNLGAGINAQTSSYVRGSACTVFNYGTDPVTGQPTATCKTSVPFAYTQGTYAVLSGRISYQIDPRWNAAINVNNLTDRVYYQTMGSSSGGGWYGEPRNYMLTVRGTF